MKLWEEIIRKESDEKIEARYCSLREKLALLEKKYLDATIRFSLCYDTTEDDVNGCLEVLEALIPMLRRFTRGGRR